MSIISRRLLASLVLCHLTGAAGLPARAQRHTVSDLRTAHVGPYWVALRWESGAAGHDVLWRQARPGRRAAPPRAATGIAVTEYSVVNLKPDTPYEFRIRPRQPDDGDEPLAEPPPLIVTTMPDRPRHIVGLALSPPRPLAPLGDALTEPCIEAFGGKLYVLEAHDDALTLSRLTPDALRVEWRRDLAPGIVEPPRRPRAPDMCAFEDRLWITWRDESPDEGDPRAPRCRLISYDPAADGAEGTPAGALGVPVEIRPSALGRAVCCASLAPLMDGLWVSWVEVWRDDEGRRRGTLMLAQYEPWRGRLARPVAWRDCPVRLPGRPSIALFGSDLVVLFSDEAAHETTPGREPLWCARFDGKRFHHVHLLRTLGANREARGVQLGDRFYFVYRSDAHYPGSGGVYHDIALGRLLPVGAGPRVVMDQFISGLPYITDLKYNSAPDITVLGEAMYTVHGKRDDARILVADDATAPRPRGFGTYIGRITRVLERGAAQ